MLAILAQCLAVAWIAVVLASMWRVRSAGETLRDGLGAISKARDSVSELVVGLWRLSSSFVHGVGNLTHRLGTVLLHHRFSSPLWWWEMAKACLACFKQPRSARPAPTNLNVSRRVAIIGQPLHTPARSGGGDPQVGQSQEQARFGLVVTWSPKTLRPNDAYELELKQYACAIPGATAKAGSVSASFVTAVVKKSGPTCRSSRVLVPRTHGTQMEVHMQGSGLYRIRIRVVATTPNGQPEPASQWSAFVDTYSFAPELVFLANLPLSLPDPQDLYQVAVLPAGATPSELSTQHIRSSSSSSSKTEAGEAGAASQTRSASSPAQQTRHSSTSSEKASEQAAKSKVHSDVRTSAEKTLNAVQKTDLAGASSAASQSASSSSKVRTDMRSSSALGGVVQGVWPVLHQWWPGTDYSSARDVDCVLSAFEALALHSDAHDTVIGVRWSNLGALLIQPFCRRRAVRVLKQLASKDCFLQSLASETNILFGLAVALPTVRYEISCGLRADLLPEAKPKASDEAANANPCRDSKAVGSTVANLWSFLMQLSQQIAFLCNRALSSAQSPQPQA